MNTAFKSAIAAASVGLVAGYFLKDKVDPLQAQIREKLAKNNQSKHDEELLDDALDDSFPASDPVSVSRID